MDCVRYMHRAGGINGVAQIVKDIGSSADPRKLAKAAASYEGASVRRLGYLLELSGHARQANALEPFVRSAKSFRAPRSGCKGVRGRIGRRVRQRPEMEARSE